MRYDLDQLKDATRGVQEGLASSINNVGAAQQQHQERDFMLSRQTLGRPGPMAMDTAVYGVGQAQHQADTLNTRSMQGGATIVTQFNRDNLDEDYAATGTGGYDEIDDLRRA